MAVCAGGRDYRKGDDVNDSKPKTVFDERDQLKVQNAQLQFDIDDLTFCEDCGEDCGKMPENNCYPPRYCHGCRHDLVCQIVELKRELEAARKAANAAAAVAIAGNAILRAQSVEGTLLRAIMLLLEARDAAQEALACAVREYRAHERGE